MDGAPDITSQKTLR